jgi:hypothetical protein
MERTASWASTVRSNAPTCGSFGWSLRHRWVIVTFCVLSIVAIPFLGKAANNFLP